MTTRSDMDRGLDDGRAAAGDPARPTVMPTARACPQCGLPGSVVGSRRSAEDFCRRCDFPLFWAGDRVERALVDEGVQDSLRRSPGTVGSAALASTPCPACAELNLPSATTCVRCGSGMEPPPPVVVIAPVPEPFVLPPLAVLAGWRVLPWRVIGSGAALALLVAVVAAWLLP
ncbi:hypothetical protein [Cellulomonas timonensis]|uniref:hypothetical protein n=1 Tax=Cellulomonas timonensis TaxID=1689271 RepID=UPI00082E6CE9|nr:hypothetical protein [Cellulomonas timonensis]